MKKYFTGLIAVLVCFTVTAQNNYSFPVQAKTANGIIEGNYDTKAGLQ